MAESVETLSNFVGGRWIPAAATEFAEGLGAAAGLASLTEAEITGFTGGTAPSSVVGPLPLPCN